MAFLFQKIIKKLFWLTNSIHTTIFKQPISLEATNFLKNFTLSFAGGVISSFSLFLINIIGGKLMGPSEYGKVGMVSSLGQIFMISMLLGIDIANLRINPRLRSAKSKKDYLSTTYISTIALIIVTFFILSFLNSSISQFLKTDLLVVRFAILFSIIYSFKTLFDSFIRCYALFKWQAIARIFESFIIFSTFILLMIFSTHHFFLIIIPPLFGSIVTVVLFFYKVKNKFGKFRLKILKRLFKYAKFIVLEAIIATIFIYGDKLLINRYLGSESLGVYMAYFTSSILFVNQLIAINNNVFFSTITKIKNKQIIAKKLDKVFMIAFIPAVIALSVTLFLIINLYGNEYPVYFSFIIMFGILGSLQLFSSPFLSIVNTHSLRTYSLKIGLWSLKGFLYMMYILLLVILNRLTILNILIALILNEIANIIGLRYIISKYIN